MARLEEYTLARDTVQNVEGLRRDMRRNAAGYKADRLSSRLSIAQLGQVMAQDASEYVRRLGWQDRVDTGALRLTLANGLAALGIPPTEVRAAVSELKTTATALRDAPKETAADIDAAADAVLATVAQHETVWN